MADAAPYLSAVAALAGTFSGGVTSVATSWLGQQLQTKEQRRAQEKAALQTLYKEFIESASRLYLDALEHNSTEVAKLVDIYTTLNLVTSNNVQTLPSTSCPDSLACAAWVAAGSLLLRTNASAADAHLFVPRRKNGQPSAHDGRDRAQPPTCHFIQQFGCSWRRSTHRSFRHIGTTRICDTRCAR
jgi:hypothetical protein